MDDKKILEELFARLTEEEWAALQRYIQGYVRNAVSGALLGQAARQYYDRDLEPRPRPYKWLNFNHLQEM